METTIIMYWGFKGIMEKKRETSMGVSSGLVSRGFFWVGV